MATGHILPGYGDKPPAKSTQRRFRSKSVDPAMSGERYRNILQQHRVDPELLQSIKAEARDAWMEELRDWTKTPDIKRPTTYEHAFYHKLQPPSDIRPTSPTRRNNPHPPMVFLNCHLRSVPGFHDPDAAIERNYYKIDATCPQYEQKRRQMLREKYSARPTTAITNSVAGHRQALQRVLTPRQAQATEAWMQAASAKDRRTVERLIERTKDKSFVEDSIKKFVKPQYKPSLHRYLKYAGASESKATSKMFESAKLYPRHPPMVGPHFHVTDYSYLLNPQKS